MATSSVDVSVIVPCYNTEKYLDQALSSAEQNNRIALEIIVVDDGSSDKSANIMEEHAAHDSRITVIHKNNAGYGAAVNDGIARSQGTYVAILEPDDWVEPHTYDDLYEFATTFVSQSSNASKKASLPQIVKSPYWRIWMPETPQQKRYFCAYAGRIKPAHQPFALMDEPRLVMHHPSIWSALYLRSFLDEYTIRFKEVPGAGWVDNPFLFETMLSAERIVYKDVPYYNYREDLPQSSSAQRTARLALERWNDMTDVCKKHDVDDVGILQALYTIGARYVAQAVDEGALKDPELAAQIERIAQRMDPEILLNAHNISCSMRSFLLDQAHYSYTSCQKLPYYKHLAQEFRYSWRTNGAAFAFSRVGLFFRRKAAEKGLASPLTTKSASI